MQTLIRSCWSQASNRSGSRSARRSRQAITSASWKASSARSTSRRIRCAIANSRSARGRTRSTNASRSPRWAASTRSRSTARPLGRPVGGAVQLYWSGSVGAAFSQGVPEVVRLRSAALGSRPEALPAGVAVGLGQGSRRTFLSRCQSGGAGPPRLSRVGRRADEHPAVGRPERRAEHRGRQCRSLAAVRFRDDELPGTGRLTRTPCNPDAVGRPRGRPVIRSRTEMSRGSPPASDPTKTCDSPGTTT